MPSLDLRYGMNPHQAPARAYVTQGTLPFKVLNGAPSTINILDALNAWALVRELKGATGLAAAASFKHVSPAGAAVAVPLSDELKRAYFLDDAELSPVATAYARARGADAMSSFGDCVAVSDVVDESLAQVLKREVSDCIIAPSYQLEALHTLKEKKGGKYLILQISEGYEPDPMEYRQVFGITLEQPRNAALIDEAIFDDIVTENRELGDEARRDLLVATLALKYTMSNSVCYAYDGQVIGNGAGQQSRVHCTRLAGDKADHWFLRRHPRTLDLPFRDGISRAEKNNAVDRFLLPDLSGPEEEAWRQAFDGEPQRLSAEERREWLDQQDGVALSSDGFFPFRDNIDRAARSGVRYIVQPGGSNRDDEVTAAADQYGMVMAMSGLRLFHH